MYIIFTRAHFELFSFFTLTRFFILPIRVAFVRSVLCEVVLVKLPVRFFFNHGFGFRVGRTDHTRPLFIALIGIFGTMPVVILRLELEFRVNPQICDAYLILGTAGRVKLTIQSIVA